jgi:Protein of unknown function (DUF3604)
MKKHTVLITVVSGALVVGMLQVPAFAQDAGHPDPEALAKVANKKPGYSPYAGRDFPTRVFFGGTHVHTATSFDAGAFGTTLGPGDAYRFASGEEVTSNSGQRVKLSRPLDFLVVTDHSDNMGFFPDLMAGKQAILANPTGRKWYDMVKAGKGADVGIEAFFALFQGTYPKELMYNPGSRGFRRTWDVNIAAAEQYNDPGHFTAFIGYEWSASVKGNNLHRNVVFRDGSDKASQVEPIVTNPPVGNPDPAFLWKWMEAYEKKTGGSVLAIAHNGNLSNGMMFPMIETFGKVLDADYVKTRARWERLIEVTQTKGTGEAHPFLSPNDEFADFELWDKGNLDLSVAKKKEMLQYEYAREALKNGMKLEQKLGANPYKFGMIGSTDTHTALSSAEDDNFFGKMATAEPSIERLINTFTNNKETGLAYMDWEVGAAGRAAVWATENTREAIFDAMDRKETYATTGTRMMVRFFGGFDFEPGDANNRMPARIGYTKGVPMGGDLAKAPEGKAPTFLVAALKDPIGANLDRVQIIKGWVGKDGKTQERIHDVAVSGDREIGADGRCKTSVGSTVDVENATWTNTIGTGEMITVWKDSDFDPALQAFYYVRVIEIPTPRWTAYDAKYYGTKPMPGIPMVVTERAYTSPIWYTP